MTLAQESPFLCILLIYFMITFLITFDYSSSETLDFTGFQAYRVGSSPTAGILNLTENP